MIDNEKRPLIACTNKNKIFITPEMINRHGLIAGATGSGKTVSLQTLAETFSNMGIAVFMADVKGDLSGIAKSGVLKGKVSQRIENLGLLDSGYKNRSFPVCFWDVYGKDGHPLRTTISEIGPILLARLLNLNDVQTGVLNIIFRIADDSGLLLLDMKDLKAIITYAGENRDKFKTEYGQISSASIGAIMRALLRLEDEGAENFFGEPALDIMDLIQTDNGYGIINILDATKLINYPGLYSCVLLWLLSELYERLPEAGDTAKPKLVFFFDEAHLLFNDISPLLLQKIEQTVRLIRSKAVGIYFVSQNPSDIPDSISGQLGNRIQHVLRAFTPKDQKALKAAAQTFRPNPDFSAQDAIGSLGVGEALVSFLDQKGSPQIVEKAFIVPPEGQIGPIDDLERKKIIENSFIGKTYNKSIDRESAYEILTARTKNLNTEKAEISKKSHNKSGEKDIIGDIFGSVIRQTARTATNAIGREIGKAVLRGLLGGIFGSKK